MTVASPALLLFDIDGTLVQRASAEHAAALREAIAEVHGITEAPKVEAAGRTDLEIARAMLLAAGVAPERIDAGHAAVREATVAAYVRRCPADLSGHVVPGIPEALAALQASAAHRLALVTGNLEPVARLKLRRAGVGHFFPPGQGGFGSDSEDRADLPGVARQRAGADGQAHPRERTVVIGDTPRDIACARADGVAVIAVTTGPYAVADLAEADAVIDGPAALDAALAAVLG